MENSILGIHHITAIASDPKRNLDFYTRVLGQRFVKKTVNFDDPGTYHFYFGNETGAPGTILTFFPWPGATKGKVGTGMATEILYTVPQNSLDFWKQRFDQFGVKQEEASERFGETILPFEDPDGLKLALVTGNDSRKPWVTNEVEDAVATRGFHGIVLTVKQVGPTAKVLTDLFGYQLLKQEGNRFRFVTSAIENASVVDIVEAPQQPAGRNAAGTNHHVAFRVKDDKILMDYREKVASQGFNITPKIDRDYFFSLYFREPGGVLFEIATDNPGFTRDEPVSDLGTSLKLPRQYEASRASIEKTLPVLD